MACVFFCENGLNLSEYLNLMFAGQLGENGSVAGGRWLNWRACCPRRRPYLPVFGKIGSFQFQFQFQFRLAEAETETNRNSPWIDS